MESIYITKKVDSPKVILDYESGLIEFTGKSYTANAFEFYAPIIEWIKEYFSGNSQKDTIINFKLEYVNSASIQVIFNILDIVSEGEYKNLEVNWCYDERYEDSYDDYLEIQEEFPTLVINPIKCM